MTRRVKYTQEVLQEAVIKSNSIIDVCKHLFVNPSGGTYYHINERIKYFNIDISHFDGLGMSRGGKVSSIKLKLKPEQILVSGKLIREKPYKLRRALIESSIEYKCIVCNITKWNNKEITLHVDHIDGDWSNCIIENLRFLCPNCHSQTDNFGSKNRKRS